MAPVTRHTNTNRNHSLTHSSTHRLIHIHREQERDRKGIEMEETERDRMSTEMD